MDIKSYIHNFNPKKKWKIPWNMYGKEKERIQIKNFQWIMKKKQQQHRADESIQ